MLTRLRSRPTFPLLLMVSVMVASAVFAKSPTFMAYAKRLKNKEYESPGTAVLALSVFEVADRNSPVRSNESDVRTNPDIALTASEADEGSGIRTLPFYSQFADIAWPSWRGKSCGVASVAMIVDYYRDDAPSAQQLLEIGLDNGYYIRGAGWAHRGLIKLAERYGVNGTMHGFAHLSDSAALARLATILERGPVIASVHNKFDPQSTIPHLVVIRDLDDSVVYYNDPAEPAGGGEISIERFQAGWKKRIIAMNDS